MRILILLISMFMLGFASVFAFAKTPVVDVPLNQTFCTVINDSSDNAAAEVYCSNLQN